MFTRLRTKLTILFAGLFGLTLLLVGAAVYSAIANNAERSIREDLRANGAVFDRIWALRARQLTDSADLLARDFGFREAVATRDSATIASALQNLRGRLAIDRAFIINMDGEITGLDVTLSEDAVFNLWSVLDSGERAEGVMMIGGAPHQAVSAPVLAPSLSGWVVFASKLDSTQMRAFEQLAAIPLRADVLTRNGAESWRATGEMMAAADQAALAEFAARANNADASAPRDLRTSDGAAIALVQELRAMDGEGQALLLLRYPRALALAPYRPLLAATVLISVFGIALLAFGAWMLARGVTRPIQALDEAARALQQGHRKEVRVETRDEIGRLAQSFNQMSDEIAQRERRITHLALHDPETDLPNRRALQDALAARAGEARVFVIAFGIDRFQHMRAAIGHKLANLLVREIGARLSNLRPDLAMARLSPDTLAVLLEAESDEAARAIAAGLGQNLEAPVRLDGHLVDVGLSIGLALHDGEPAVSLEHAMIAVDQARAMHAKTAMFDAAAYGDPARNLSLMGEMLDAMNNGALWLAHQPKYDIRQGAITGVEALVRWRHPTRGMIAPDLFVGMAEETGNIRALTEWVLTRAIADQIKFRAAGHELLMSVNVSGRLIDDPEFIDLALEMIEDTEASICFEITETAVIGDPERALQHMERLAAASVRISIDDYGSGLSSLAYLKQIKAHELKIDKAFILSLADSQRDALLVKSTIDLAHSLGLKVTAEGVETAPALALLGTMGCDLAQGYLIGKPMPAVDLISVLNTPHAPDYMSKTA